MQAPLCHTERMSVEFAASRRSSVGIEWEIMLADPVTGDLVGRAPEFLDGLQEESRLERHSVTGELLTNTVEVTSGIGTTVAQAADDIADAIADIRRHTDPLGIDLLCAGSHPFARWYDQEITDKTRYHSLIEKTQWWGRNMMIWGIHVHVGVDDVRKVMPIVNALSVYLPHLQALSASSPFWAGETTGYASNRSLVFQQLPTAGLPWPLQDWSEFQGYLDDMIAADVLRDETEVRWDVRPAPRWGTIEVRACDGMSTLPELAAVAAFVQCLVEHFSRELDAGRELRMLQPWFIRENKWRAARYGLEAEVIVHPSGERAPVAEHIRTTVESLREIADDLRCRRELRGILTILDTGASYARQRAVADANGGDLREVVRHLVREFRDGPTLRQSRYRV